MEDQFVEGQTYRRKDIHHEFGGQERGGISTPANAPFVFIFTGKSGEQYGYKDGWTSDGTYLYTGEGQEGDMRFVVGNRAIRDHKENGKELLLFKEVRKAFVEFVGAMQYTGYQIRRGPDKTGADRDVIVFELKQISQQRQTLSVVTTDENLRINLTTFNANAARYAARALNMLRQTTYWIYDEERDQFGPSKFLGYEAMNFDLYDLALRSTLDGARFDGFTAREAIQQATGQSFLNEKLSASLTDWGQRLFGPDVFAGVDAAKWQFLRLASKRRFWAFAANPSIYRIEEAIAEKREDFWTVKGSDVRRGDRFLVWRTAGRSRHRGAVALGEVLSNPEVLELPSEYQRYCIDPALLMPQERVRIRYVVPSGVPLWLDDDSTGTLSRLSVTRATGGSIFHISPADWSALTRLLGGWPADGPLSSGAQAEGERVSSQQGYNVDSKMRMAVEKYAVEKAKAHYKANGYDVEERGKPYDLRCTKEVAEVRHVEVKGTETEGEDVLLTPNEVAFANSHHDSMELFVVSSCVVVSDDTGIAVSGGKTRVFTQWRIDPAALTPTGYSYSLPESTALNSSRAAKVG